VFLSPFANYTIDPLPKLPRNRFKTLHRCGWQGIAPTADDTFVDWWLQVRKVVHKPRHKAFDYLSILVSLCLWCQRNDRVFLSNISMIAAGLATHIWSLLVLWCHASLVARPHPLENSALSFPLSGSFEVWCVTLSSPLLIQCNTMRAQHDLETKIAVCCPICKVSVC
jgi:hypothetical protein